MITHILKQVDVIEQNIGNEVIKTEIKLEKPEILENEIENTIDKVMSQTTVKPKEKPEKKLVGKKKNFSKSISD